MSFQCCGIIRRVRHDQYGEDKYLALEQKYGNAKRSEAFLMFSIYWCDDEGPQRILGFALNSLIKLLKYKSLFLHIDAKFNGAPRGFYQVLIFSVLDQGTNLHVPILYCPMTRKSEEAYNLLWMHITTCLGE